MPYLQIDSSIDVSHSGNKASLAYSTARTRWPKIIVAAIADVQESLSNHSLTDIVLAEGHNVVQDLKKLLSSMETNGRLMPLPEDGAEDISAYNLELTELGSMTWHDSPWLYTECYLYRMIHTCFSRRETTFWKTYDVFARQKLASLRSSSTVIVELVQWFNEISDKIQEKAVKGEGNLKALMEEMLQVSLWGNATDLLLLISVSVEELQSRQGKKARETFRENVVDDDTEQVWDLLSAFLGSASSREIHIVLDNSGFEFTTDLVLAAYLLAADYATTVVLHGKSIPWFVSDVTANDLGVTLDVLKGGGFSRQLEGGEARSLSNFGSQLDAHFQHGRLRYEAHPFWTTQHPYARLPVVAPQLFQELAAAELVIFKGDLNYRKLVFDGLWPRTTPFQLALGSLGSPPPEDGGSGLRILALRTCKADTCVGLAPGREEEVDPQRTGEWTRNGKYAIISFCDANQNKSL